MIATDTATCYNSTMNRRQILALIAAAIAAGPARATPEKYTLDRDQSSVSFNYTLNGLRSIGKMPILEADVLLDLDHPENSQVTAVIDAAHAQAGLFFATDAMKSAQVLDTGKYPTIRFVSDSVVRTKTGASIAGKITIRDVTLPITLDATLYRRTDDKNDLSKISILMKGQIDRRQFGATGYPDIVGPMIGLNILTRVDRV